MGRVRQIVSDSACAFFVPRIVVVLTLQSSPTDRLPTPFSGTPNAVRFRRLFLGIGATLGMQALAVMFVVRAASVPNRAPEKGDPESKSSISSDSSYPNDALPYIHDEDAAHHRGWLVLVWASVAPVPPEKPEKGERAFAELVNGELRLRRERGGDAQVRRRRHVLSRGVGEPCRAAGGAEARRAHGFTAERRHVRASHRGFAPEHGGALSGTGAGASGS